MNPRSMSVSIKPPPRGDDLPFDDDEPMDSWRHQRQMILLADSLDFEWRDRQDVHIAADMALYYSPTQALNREFRCPDVFVVLDAERRERKRWVVWEENGRTPDVVVELVSETTERVDRGVKMDIYARLVHVLTYVIYDPFSARLDVFELDPAARRYRPQKPDARGYYWCAPLGLFVGVVPGTCHGVEAPWLRWIRDDGSPILEEGAAQTERAYRESQRAEQEAQRAEQEAQRANQESQRAAELEDEVARLRAELAKLR